MTDTTHRLLRLLSMLESRSVWSGPELAERLGVTTRTVRRDMERLRDLGYPVTGEHGADGGYRLGAGRKLPPLVLDDDEAVAVAVSLRLGAIGPVAGISEPAVRALAKLDQVLPARLRGQVTAIDQATAALPTRTGPRVDATLLSALATAQRDHVRVRFAYRARDGAETQRHVEPYRLVTTGFVWYLVCYDLDRDDWRTFRADRIAEHHVTTFRFTPRPAPDPLELVQAARQHHEPWPITATVLLSADVDAVRGRIPERYARAREIEPGLTEVRIGAEKLEDLAWHLGWAAVDLSAELTVLDHPELAAQLARLGEQFTRFGKSGPGRTLG
ncbi:helix-turn-helix transcriptional regulator [Granulicoccus phenolivorans]|uniref:helix-turn-helix transcriptional regulator n=1 Tax=Granulicoccus phenolivorans TaxID=266854 RepID=UPI0003FF30AF|nr:YafY family protein [Granulicoccus phenolivorans]